MPLIRKPDGGPASAPPRDARHDLLSGNAEERWAAARRLGAEQGHAALLAEALAREKDARVREVLFSALAHDGGDVAVAAILPFIRSPDASLRTAALDALAMMPTAIAAHIAALLSDPDADVRILSCDLARRLPTAEASRHLARLLEREQVVNVCGAAVEVLSEVGDESALAALHACAARFPNEAFLGFAIELAARRIGEGRDLGPPATA
jgi:HEAT repeat protein